MVTELNIESYVKEYSVVPEIPDKGSLTLGNTVTFANYEWIVSHVTDTEAYLTLNGVFGESIWDGLQDTCIRFANKFTETQKAYLKSVTAGNTSGIVFVATYDQMDGGFSYFNSNSHRRINEKYWTSTEVDLGNAWLVYLDGSLDHGYGSYQSDSNGFRPSVCVDMTLYT